MALTVRVPARPLYAALVVGHAWVGGAWILASPALVSAASLTVLRAWAPMPVWGGLVLGGALLTLATARLPRRAAVAAHALAAAPLLVVVVATLLALAGGVGLTGSTALFLIPAVVHLALGQARWREAPHVRVVV